MVSLIVISNKYKEMILSFLDKFKMNRKAILLVLFVLVWFLMSFDVVSADDYPNGAVNSISDLMDWLAKILLPLMGIIASILGLMSYIVALFLSPEWISGSMFGLTEVNSDTGALRNAWLLVSNIVYVIFAFLIVFVAFMNIIGKSGQWELKQAFPRFMIGILIVPASWWIVNLVFSITTVLAVTIIGLPLGGGIYKQDDFKIRICERPIEINLTASSFISLENYTCTDSKKKEISIKKLIDESKSVSEVVYRIIYVYIYDILKLDGISRINTESNNPIEVMSELGVVIIMDFIFVLFFAVSLLVLGVVLFVRGIYVWLFIMFCPIFGLLYFMGKENIGGNSQLSKINFKEFIGLAMVPVFAVGALSFGIMLMGVMAKGLEGGSAGISLKDGTLKISGIELRVNMKNNKTPDDTKVLGWQLDLVGFIILRIMGIIIIWFGVIGAAKSSSLVSAAASPIENFVNSTMKGSWNLAKNAALATPIVPGGLGSYNPNKLLSSINSRLESKFSDVANHVAEKFVPLSESAKQVDDALKGLRDPATSAIQAFEYMGILARAGRQKAALEALNKNEKLKNEMHLKDKLEREGFANFENGNWTQTAEQIEKTKSIKPSTNTTGNGGSGNGLTDEDARDQKVKISNGEKIFDVGVSVNMNKNSKTAEKLIIKSDDVTIEQLGLDETKIKKAMKDALLAQYGLDETSAENNTEVNAQLEGIKSMNINADWIERNVEFRGKSSTPTPTP